MSLGVGAGPSLPPAVDAGFPRYGDFRKKPVIIQAWKFPCFEYGDPSGEWVRHMPEWVVEAERSGVLAVVDKPHMSDWAHLEIKTLEGTMTAEPGDWIIRGVKQEIYPCKPDIFAATYEVVT